ncbi:MAG: LicD family protein, partial [Scrofimicrobium sp.]
HYGLAHGHAAALSLRAVWGHYAAVVDDNPERFAELAAALAELNAIFGVMTSGKALSKFDAILDTLRLEDAIDVSHLVDGVNVERLNNSPLAMTAADLEVAYEQVLGLREAPPRKRFPGTTGRFQPVTRRDLPELHAHELKILAQFDEFCTAHGLQYYLSEGSMLGAVRHGGFIPWDDDLDIMMPRADYDRLLDLVRQGALPGNLNLDCFETNRRHWVLGAKLQTTEETRFVQPQVAHVSHYSGPHIDIFILDPVEKIDGWRFRLQAYILRGLRRGLFMSSGSSAPRLGTNTAARIPIFLATQLVSTKTVHKAIVYFQANFNSRPSSTHWANLCSYYPPQRETFPRTWFGAGRRVEFEGLSVCIPERTEDMLGKIYGPDYLSIPVLEDGYREHAFFVRPVVTPDASV